MAVSINNNIASLGAQRRLGDATKGLTQSFTRLSSGLRINSGADDAAGLAVGSLLKTDARVFTQGVRNANDALGLLNIAEGATRELSGIVIRVKELAEQAANGVLSSPQRRALDAEAQALIAEYGRITQTTEFNGLKLLNGSELSVNIQLGYSTNSVGFSLSSFLNGGGSASAVGDGTFKAGVNYIGGTASSGTELGDLDGDGDLDMVVSDHFGPNGVQVFLNNGNGTFQARTAYGAGRDFYDLKLKDFNGDGRLDIVAGDYGNEKIQLYMNTGTGTFTTGLSFLADADPTFMDVADINGDTFQDVVVNSQTTGKVDVFLGTGGGSFAASVSYAGGGWNIALTDIDKDGDQDVLTGTANGFNVLYNGGSGTFSAPTFMPGSAGSSTSFGIGDFDGDNDTDVVMSSVFGVEVLLNTGTGTSFAVGGQFVAPQPQSATVADLNGDGFLDLALPTRAGAGSVGYVLGNGNGTFKAPTTLSTAGPFQDAAIGDVDGDGALDIVASQYNGANIAVFMANAIQGQGQSGSTLLNQVDLTTKSTALASLDYTTSAMNNVTRELGNYGSAQSRLSTAIQNLLIGRENIGAAASRIFDVDVAEESSRLTRLQILQQSAQGILAQANQLPELALRLLRS